MQISRKFSHNKHLVNNNNNNKVNNFKNYIIRGNNIKKNIEKKIILEEIKNTKNIKQYGNYSKRNKKLSSDKIREYNLKKNIYLNNIINSFKTNYSDYNNFENNKKNLRISI